MRLTMKERKRVAAATAGRYRRERKREKTGILNEFVELTGFARSYAAMGLRNHGRAVTVNPKLRGRGDVGKKLRRPGRRPDYEEEVGKAMLKVGRVTGKNRAKGVSPRLRG